MATVCPPETPGSGGVVIRWWALGRREGGIGMDVVH